MTIPQNAAAGAMATRDTTVPRRANRGTEKNAATDIGEADHAAVRVRGAEGYGRGVK